LPTFPDFIAHIGPSDFLTLFDTGSGLPLPSTYLEVNHSVAVLFEHGSVAVWLT
jgi:hypothetical protein